MRGNGTPEMMLQRLSVSIAASLGLPCYAFFNEAVV